MTVFCKILLVLRQHNIKDSFHFVIFQGVHQDGSVNFRIVFNQMDQDLKKKKDAPPNPGL